QYGLCSFPRTSPSSAAPASIITCAHEPCATMWIVELVKNTITGHIRTPIRNANDGHRYGLHGRRPQASSPTIASARRSRPMIRKPVANHQWTNSAFGSILDLFQVLEQPGCNDEREDEPDDDHVQRWLREQPPESLLVRMQEGQPVRLQERPGDAGDHRQRADQIDGDSARRSSAQLRGRLGCE